MAATPKKEEGMVHQEVHHVHESMKIPYNSKGRHFQWKSHAIRPYGSMHPARRSGFNLVNFQWNPKNSGEIRSQFSSWREGNGGGCERLRMMKRDLNLWVVHPGFHGAFHCFRMLQVTWRSGGEAVRKIWFLRVKPVFNQKNCDFTMAMCLFIGVYCIQIDTLYFCPWFSSFAWWIRRNKPAPKLLRNHDFPLLCLVFKGIHIYHFNTWDGLLLDWGLCASTSA